jgi:hypothetical protein
MWRIKSRVKIVRINLVMKKKDLLQTSIGHQAPLPQIISMDGLLIFETVVMVGIIKRVKITFYVQLIESESKIAKSASKF